MKYIAAQYITPSWTTITTMTGLVYQTPRIIGESGNFCSAIIDAVIVASPGWTSTNKVHCLAGAAMGSFEPMAALAMATFWTASSLQPLIRFDVWKFEPAESAQPNNGSFVTRPHFFVCVESVV